MIAILRETFNIADSDSVLRRVSTFTASYMDILHEGKHGSTINECIGTTSLYSHPTLAPDEMTAALCENDHWSGEEQNKRNLYVAAHWPMIQEAILKDGEWRHEFLGCEMVVYFLEA